MRINEFVRIEMVASIVEVVIVSWLFAWLDLNASIHGTCGSYTSYLCFGHFSYFNILMVAMAVTVFSTPLIGSWVQGEYVKVAAIVTGDTVLYAMLEDIFFFIQAGSWSNPQSWTTWIFSGFYLLGLWIPSWYIGAIVSVIILYAVAFIFTD